MQSAKKEPHTFLSYTNYKETPNLFLISHPLEQRCLVHGNITMIQYNSMVSVLIDSKYPYSMELGQLWKEYSEKRAGVYQEMRTVIFCVETGENIQHDG